MNDPLDPLDPLSRPKLRSASNRLRRAMGNTIAEHRLIQAGDHIMVAVSGGKDSYTLLDLLHQAQAKAPIRFRLTAVHLDQVQPGYDGARLRRWLEDFGAAFEIIQEDTYSAVIERTRAGKAFCAVCSRLRRGVLYTVAERLGCNKIALGHHRDDALETLLLNLFYAGKLQAMPAKYTTDDGRFEVIRPLIECAEADIVEHASAAGYPILPCNLCGSQTNLQRDKMRDLIDSLAVDSPNVRAVMLNALRNLRPSHLLDRAVAEAWRARPQAEPADAPEPADAQAAALTQLRITRAGR